MRYQQLGLISRKQFNAMLDRALARNWSPEKEAFRRDHERRRKWGLAQRHGLKLLRLRREEHAKTPDLPSVTGASPQPA
ncbi:hypothetical protein ACQPZJ_09450 [Actinoplanes sp. CA-054009]